MKTTGNTQPAVYMAECLTPAVQHFKKCYCVPIQKVKGYLNMSEQPCYQTTAHGIAGYEIDYR